MTETAFENSSIEYRIDISDRTNNAEEVSSKVIDDGQATPLLPNNSSVSSAFNTTPKHSKSLQLYYGTWRSVESLNQPTIVVKSNVQLRDHLQTIFVVVWALILVFLIIGLVTFLV